MSYARITIRSLHCVRIRFPPSAQGRLTRKPTIIRLDVGIVFHHLQPTIRPQQPLDILHVRAPSAGFDALCDEARVDEIVCVPLEYGWVVELIVEVVPKEGQVLRLICE